jgi:hypothetical protein
MSKPSSMTSRVYCTSCGSFKLKKVHRGFFEKRVLNSENKFQCKSCNALTRESEFNTNELRRVPMFID